MIDRKFDYLGSFFLSFPLLNTWTIWMFQEYLGRTLRVNFSDKPKPKEPLYPETEYKLFVGNLSWSVTSESLTQAFQEYGNVVGARVLYDGETGRSRGYGFVCFSTKSEMDTALESLNGVVLVSPPPLPPSFCFPIFLNLLDIFIFWDSNWSFLFICLLGTRRTRNACKPGSRKTIIRDK